MIDAILNFSLGFCIGVAVLFAVAIQSAIPYEKNKIMQDAYDRGYAVQCVGLVGYYWECPAEVDGEDQ